MKKILVAEDDKSLQKAYEFKLGQKGYEVRCANNGQEALEILKSFTPELIILDLMMPVMDGFSFLQSIKSSTEQKDIPVIVATNMGKTQDAMRAMELGAVDYIVKTDVTTDELMEKIQTYLSGE